MTRRPGLTLLEVVIALAIFMISLVGLSTLINNGTNLALDVQQQAEASQLCQSKLAEVIVGAERGAEGEITQNRAAWRWAVETSPGDLEGLNNVLVKVWMERQDGSTIQASLGQMVLDPAMRGSTHIPAPATNPSASTTEATESTTPSTGSTTTPSTTGGTTSSGTNTGGTTPSGTKTGGNTKNPGAKTPGSK